MKQVNEVPKSVLNQLAEVAQQQQESLEALVAFYSQERLLVRLAASSYEDQYWLYGEFLLGTLTNDIVKSSSGITLCAKKMVNKESIIKHAFKEISSVKVAEDGVAFVSDEIEVSSSGEEEVQIRIPAQIGHITTYIEIAITLFNSASMAPRKIATASLLNSSSTELLAYPTELIIAHKFNTIYQYPTLEETLKDYYAIYLLASTQNFEGRVLQEAILDTFERHKTTIEKNPPVFSNRFDLDESKNKAWQQLLTQQVSFAKVQKLVHQFLWPIYNQIEVENEFFENWDYTCGNWR